MSFELESLIDIVEPEVMQIIKLWKG